MEWYQEFFKPYKVHLGLLDQTGLPAPTVLPVLLDLEGAPPAQRAQPVQLDPREVPVPREALARQDQGDRREPRGQRDLEVAQAPQVHPDQPGAPELRVPPATTELGETLELRDRPVPPETPDPLARKDPRARRVAPGLLGLREATAILARTALLALPVPLG